MLDLAENATQQISPTELEFLEGIFDRVCMCCDIERPSERADQLARFIVNEFRAGVREEAALFECAMWKELPRSKKQAIHEHD